MQKAFQDMKNVNRFIERRRYIRLQAPIGMSYTVDGTEETHAASTKNISAAGLRFETFDKKIEEGFLLEMKLNIPSAPNAVHVKGKVIWKKRLSLEDQTPFDVGVEFVEIEEDNKNTFLKFLCDLLYLISEERKNG